MKVAIISDIHGNRQAFEAVLTDIVDASVSEVWCLGDLVGYGADPDACVDLARDNADLCLAGNHDLAVAGKLPLDDFSRGAAIVGALDPGGDRARQPRLPRDAAPVGHARGASASTTAARAMRSGSTWLSALLAELCLDATHATA